MYVTRLMLCATLLSMSDPAYAFDLTRSKQVPVPASYVGEVWVTAKTEPSKQVRYAVWRQCGRVLHSYSQPVHMQALIACELQVAQANNCTPESLNQFLGAKAIIIPLTQRQAINFRLQTSDRWQIIEKETYPKSWVDFATLDAAVNKLRREYEAMTAELREAIASRARELLEQKLATSAVKSGVTANSKMIIANTQSIADNAIAIQKNASAVAGLKELPGENHKEIVALKKQIGGVIESLAEQQKKFSEQQTALLELRSLQPQFELLSKRVDVREGTADELHSRLRKVESGISDVRADTTTQTTSSAKSKNGFLLPEVSSWLLWLLLVLLFAVAAATGVWWFVDRNSSDKDTEDGGHKLYHRVGDIEDRIDALEKSESFKLEHDFHDNFKAEGLSEEKLNSIKVGESIPLSIPSRRKDDADLRVDVYKRTDSNGPYLELQGVEKGENVIHPRRQNGKPWFTLSQLYRRLKLAEKQGKISGLNKTKQVA